MRAFSFPHLRLPRSLRIIERTEPSHPVLAKLGSDPNILDTNIASV
jgi:hypothetical protein